MSAKRDNLTLSCFFNVQLWMTRLSKGGGHPLSLPEYVIFSIIYGFSQDGDSVYRGGLRYLIDFLNISKPTAMTHLKTLTEAGLINRLDEEINGVNFVNYSVNFEAVEAQLKSFTGGKEFLPGVKNFNGGGKESLPGGGKKSLPINKDIENKENKDICASADAVASGASAPVSFHCPCCHPLTLCLQSH